MTRASPTPVPSSRLDATFDSLVRRVEHAPTLRERQAAVDTLFAHRRGDTPLHLIALPTNPTRRNLP